MEQQLQFNVRNLTELDGGKADLAINHAIRQIVNDVKDRPGDKAKRKVTIVIEAVPHLDDDSAALDTIDITIKVKTSVPLRQTHSYPMLPTEDGTLLFSPASPYNPRQGSLPFDPDNRVDGEPIPAEAEESEPDDVETL